MELKNVLQIAGAALGLLYLYLEYRANIYLWIVGIIMPIVHGALYFDSGLYADAGMNVYYVLAGLYGWIIWNNKKKSNAVANKISRTPIKTFVTLSAIFIVIYALIVYILINFTNSKVPYADGFTTALSIIAMWMLSRKYVEQWLVWLIVDIVTVALYIYKDIPITAALYTLYSCLAVVGYLRWVKMMKEER